MSASSLHPLLDYLRRLSGGRAGDSALDDGQLLHRFLTERDQSAFSALVQRYGAMVWSLCVRRLGETPEAEDAFQATFLVLVRKAASLRSPELLGPWLYGVAYRTASKQRGQRARRALRETALTEQIAEDRPETMDGDLRAILDEEINRLPTKYRLPVLFCYLQGLSCEEAAQRLGCAKGTVFSRLSRARDLLRRRLIRRGVEVSVGALAAVLAENAVLRAAPSLALREMTVRTSLLFAAGAAGQSLSAPLAALVEGVVRSMFLSKVKFALIVVLAVGMAGGGGGFLGYRSDAEQPQSKEKLKAPAATRRAVVESKENKDEPKSPAPPPTAGGEKPALQNWPDKLQETVNFRGVNDPRTTLQEALDSLSKLFAVTFDINEKAFAIDQLEDVWRTPISEKALIPPMRATLSTVLNKILQRVPAPSGATYLIRRDVIEITTGNFVVRELGRLIEGDPVPEGMLPHIPPLVWDVSKDIPLAQILSRLAEISGYNVIGDPSAGEKLQTKITVKLKNVPIDTAVRLLASMANLSVVQIDNVFFVTTADKAKHLHDEQKKRKAEMEGVMQ